MLMKPDNKNMASLIVSRINKRGEEESSMAAPADENGAIQDMSPDGLSVAADEVFSALESKDKAGFIDAMKSMVQMCSDSDDEPGAESPE